MPVMSKSYFVLLCILCYLLGIVIFLKGFFPIKPAVEGYAEWTSFENEPVPESFKNRTNQVQRTPQVYGKFVFILIDALRADFLLPSSTNDNLPKMKFLQRKIMNNETQSFLAKAHPPTVTLPRIKALTTGGIPGFVDVVLNFDSKSLLEDNMITQMKRAGKKIVFYGDDTWMNLFPDHFCRSDGTTSFFVTDYTEVDNNVTRHIESEFSFSDWDVLILHYLGLDHIGHLAGPRSPLVQPKLNEMDGIIEDIYNKLLLEDELSEKPSILLICGDHGMSDQGGHGGSSISETLTPIVLLSSVFEKYNGKAYSDSAVYQIDIVPTLSMLLGLPVPQNSLGVIITDALDRLETRDRLQKVYINAAQITRIFKQYDSKYSQVPAYQTYTRALNRHKNWLKLFIESSDAKDNINLDKIGEKTVDLYIEAMIGMRAKITASLATYDLHAMAVGAAMIWMMLIILMKLINTHHTSTSISILSISTLPFGVCGLAVLIGVQLSVCTGTYRSELLCSTQEGYTWILNSVFSLTVWLFINTIVCSWRLVLGSYFCRISISQCTIIKTLLIIGTLCHTSTMLASSFIEEEHQTWYFLTVSINSVLCVIFIKTYATGIVALTKLPESPSNYIKVTSCLNLSSSIDEDNDDEVSFEKDKAGDNSEKNLRNRKDKSVFKYDGNTSVDDAGCQNRNTPSDILKGAVFCVVSLGLCRIARDWNRTGDKWAHLPDIGDWLVRPENKLYLSLLTALSLLCVLTIWASKLNWRQQILRASAVLYVYMFRATTGDVFLSWVYGDGMISKGVIEARTVYIVAALMLLNTLFDTIKAYSHAKTDVLHWMKKHTIQKPPSWNKTYLAVETLNKLFVNVQTIWVVLMLLLVRTHNVTLVVIELAQVVCLGAVIKVMEMDITSLTLIHVWMGQAAFFYQGNFNSLAAIDVSAGYIGLDTYQPVLIGILLALATYAGPLLWLLSLLVRVTDKVASEMRLNALKSGLDEYKSHANRLSDELMHVALVILQCRCLPMAVYVILVTVERYHLFVWTVFSPKLLYEGMYSLIIALFAVGLIMVNIVTDCILR